MLLLVGGDEDVVLVLALLSAPVLEYVSCYIFLKEIIRDVNNHFSLFIILDLVTNYLLFAIEIDLKY